MSTENRTPGTTVDGSFNELVQSWEQFVEELKQYGEDVELDIVINNESI